MMMNWYPWHHTRHCFEEWLNCIVSKSYEAVCWTNQLAPCCTRDLTILQLLGMSTYTVAMSHIWIWALLSLKTGVNRSEMSCGKEVALFLSSVNQSLILGRISYGTRSSIRICWWCGSSHPDVNCTTWKIVTNRYRQLFSYQEISDSSWWLCRAIIQLDHDSGWGWADTILGIDGCIYWPPQNARDALLIYHPPSNQNSLIGLDLASRNLEPEGDTLFGGALATDKVIYFISSNANRIVGI